MNGTEQFEKPKFLEGIQMTPGYTAPPDPYVNAPTCHVDLPALSRYAKAQGKRLTELTKEEVEKFAV